MECHEVSHASETVITGDTSDAVDPHRWLRAVRCGWVKKGDV